MVGVGVVDSFNISLSRTNTIVSVFVRAILLSSRCCDLGSCRLLNIRLPTLELEDIRHC